MEKCQESLIAKVIVTRQWLYFADSGSWKCLLLTMTKLGVAECTVVEQRSIPNIFRKAVMDSLSTHHPTKDPPR